MTKLERLAEAMFVTASLMKKVIYRNKYRHLLKDNKQLKNKYEGRRCIILGNGPSANLLDKYPLENEVIFAVNSFFRSADSKKYAPDFYFLADPSFGKLSKEKEGDLAFIDGIGSLGEYNREMQLFVPVSYHDKMSEYGWDTKMHVRYFDNRLYFDEKYDADFEFDRPIPLFQNVVQYAISLAVYMGFNEILLFGTEQTDIINALQRRSSDENIEYEYCYKTDDATKEWVKKINFSVDLPTVLKGYSRIFQLYSQLFFYCKRRGIRIYNCSPNSLIENIPYKPVEEVFMSEQQSK